MEQLQDNLEEHDRLQGMIGESVIIVPRALICANHVPRVSYVHTVRCLLEVHQSD